MSGWTMAAQLNERKKLLLKHNVFEYARQGGSNKIRLALSSISPTLLKEILHHCTHREEQGLYRKGTPLSIAAEEGHLEVVQLLVENFNVDLDQRVATEGFYGIGITALMCASRKGHLHIVKLLVNKGCAVNLEAGQGRTAVLFACERNHLEVVKFLVENGARIDDDEEYGHTCLMASCHAGYEELVEYLLEKGANINKASRNSFTALHVAARRNCAKVVEILMRNGASMSNNSQGHTPLAEAAIRQSRDVVSFFVQSSYVGRKEKIDSLELLGAMIAREDVAAAFEYLHQAMELRHGEPNEVIPKPCSRLPAPSSFMESQTLEELEARQLDADHLHLESLAIVLRILGPTSLNVAFCYLAYIRQFLNAGHFSEALTGSVYALQITEMFDISQVLNNAFVFCVCSAFSGMLQIGQSPKYSSICKVFELSLGILQQNGQASMQSSESSACFVDLCLLCISLGLEAAKGPEETGLLQKLTESLVHLQQLIFRSGSLLHAAVSTRWDLMRHDILVQDLPVDSLVLLLVQCSADVNAMDNNKNRPLHILARCPQGYFDTETLRNITHILVEAGAPVAVLNREGKTPLDIAATEEMTDILLELYPLSLLSLAASTVIKHRVPYTGQVPKIMEEFLQRL